MPHRPPSGRASDDNRRWAGSHEGAKARPAIDRHATRSLPATPLIPLSAWRAEARAGFAWAKEKRVLHGQKKKGRRMMALGTLWESPA